MYWVHIICRYIWYIRKLWSFVNKETNGLLGSETPRLGRDVFEYGLFHPIAAECLHSYIAFNLTHKIRTDAPIDEAKGVPQIQQSCSSKPLGAQTPSLTNLWCFNPPPNQYRPVACISIDIPQYLPARIPLQPPPRRSTAEMFSEGKLISSPQRDSFRPTVREDVEPLDSRDPGLTTSWVQRISFGFSDGVERGSWLAILVWEELSQTGKFVRGFKGVEFDSFWDGFGWGPVEWSACEGRELGGSESVPNDGCGVDGEEWE